MCSKSRLLIALLSLCYVLLIFGCGDEFRVKAASTRPAGTVQDLKAMAEPMNAAAFQGTIGSQTYVEGGRLLRVRGYGLVTGLGNKGSRNCPPSVRQAIKKEIGRQRAIHPPQGKNVPTPDEMIDSLDTAVVVVEGEIPAAAGKHRTFDVTLRAMDPDTRSVAGGYLEPCDLMIYREVGPAEIIEGRPHARAWGPVFANPFADSSGTGATVDLREGTVIGGGANIEERKLSLISVIDSYATVRQIRDVINRRFPRTPAVADAVSPTNVKLSVPDEFRGREGRFLERVRYLPLSTSAIQLEVRAKLLAAEMTREDAPLDHLSLALEGIGLSVTPMIQPLYTHPRRPVNYYAARAGLRLGDELALEVIARHAKDAKSPFRRQAIRELGDAAQKLRAANVLREILADEDVQIRILSYESLRRVSPETIMHANVGRDPINFVVEVCPSDGPPTIYARRTQVRRIALIGGERMVCRPPFLYSQPYRPLVLSAAEGDRVVTLLRKNAEGRVALGPMKAPLDVPNLVRFLGQEFSRGRDGRIEGLNIDYGVVLDVLYRLCEKGGIKADIRWEEPSVEDVLGPLEPMGRPESEL